MKKTLWLIVSIFFLVSCNSNNPERMESLTPVNVCYSALSGTQATVWYAYEKGIFTKYGLDVNLVSMSGGSAAINSLISGDMDICQAAAMSVVNAIAAHQDTVIIAGLINTMPGTLITQPEISDINMLPGKVFGIDLGGSAEAITRLALEKLDLDPDRDVILLNIGSEPERVAALKARQIDATFINPPINRDLIIEGFIELYDIGSAKIPYQGTSIVTTRQFITDNPLLVTNFMKAILESISQIKKDSTGSMEVLAKYLSLDQVNDEETLKETYTILLKNTLMDIPYPTLEGIKILIEIASEDNPDAVILRPEDCVDTRILDEIRKSGFFSSLE